VLNSIDEDPWTGAKATDVFIYGGGIIIRIIQSCSVTDFIETKIFNPNYYYGIFIITLEKYILSSSIFITMKTTISRQG
jgi:hypothetical protein